MTTEINSAMDVIDSRDIIARIEELHNEAIHGEGLDADEEEELTELKQLAAKAELYVDDWEHGAALIRESYFTEYAMDLLADIGELPRDIPWYIVVDEESTAENIKQDYTELTFDGTTFYAR